jgi:lysophospholipase L1-like esterase
LGVSAEVHSLGLPGHTSRELLAALDGLELVESDPELVILLIGTNDARVDFNHVPTPKFAEALDDLVSRLRCLRTHPCVALCTLPPVVPVPFHFSEDSVRRIDGELNPAIRAVGRRLRMPVIELGDRFQKEWLLAGDVHPSETGYREMGRILAEAIGPWFRLIAPLPPTGQVKSPMKIMTGQ